MCTWVPSTHIFLKTVHKHIPTLCDVLLPRAVYSISAQMYVRFNMMEKAVVSCVLQFFFHFWYCCNNHYSWQQMEEKKKEEPVTAVCWWLLAAGVLKNNRNEIQAAKTEAKCLSLSVGLLLFIEIQMSWEEQEFPPEAKHKKSIFDGLFPPFLLPHVWTWQKYVQCD